MLPGVQEVGQVAGELGRRARLGLLALIEDIALGHGHLADHVGHVGRALHRAAAHDVLKPEPAQVPRPQRVLARAIRRLDDRVDLEIRRVRLGLGVSPIRDATQHRVTMVMVAVALRDVGDSLAGHLLDPIRVRGELHRALVVTRRGGSHLRGDERVQMLEYVTDEFCVHACSPWVRAWISTWALRSVARAGDPPCAQRRRVAAERPLGSPFPLRERERSQRACGTR